MEWSTEIYAGVYLGGPPAQPDYRSLENPNLPLNDPAVWEQVFGDYLSTDAGLSVNEDKALMYAPFWQGVNLIASVAAGLPLHHFRWLPDISATASERVMSTQDYIVSVSPSGGIEPDDYCTAVQFWESYMLDALIWGNAFAYIAYDGAGRPAQLILLNPDRTSVERLNGRLYYFTEFMDDYDQPKVKTLFPWEVLHIRGLCQYGDKAPRFMRYARNAIALGLAQQKFASKFFKNGGRVGGILELPLGMGKPARDTIEEGFRKSYEDNDNPFKTVILRDSAKFHSAQTTPNDAQMAEATEEQARMIARFLGLSPAMLGVKDSTSYNSKEQDNQAFLDHCLKRWLRKIQAECGIKLLSTQRQTREFFSHDVSDLIGLDALKQAQIDQIYINCRVKNPNEVRGKLNLLPYDGGDKYENPATSSPQNEPTPDEPAETPKEPPDEPQRSDWRVNRVLYNLTHVARQKSRNDRSFVQWLDDGFKAQREEWATLAEGEAEPQFFSLLAAEFCKAVETSTADTLPAKVEAITLTFEKGL